MKRSFPMALLAVATITSTLLGPTQAKEEAPLTATVTVDAGQTLRTMNPQRLGGTNIALWYFPSTYDAPNIQKAIRELHARYIRMPGGSWANGVYWNGNGVRAADGTVDTTKVGPDGYPAVDYSGYAPSFLVDTKTLHPASGGWHGHVDVKKQHEFIQGIPGTEAMVCPNAGTGRTIDAAEWVRWANQKMGYNVRMWEIGNELGGSWEAGTEQPLGKGPLTAEIYTKRYNEMANAMRKMDPTVKIGSCPYVREALRDCGTNIDFVSIHTYPGSTTLTETQMFADIQKSVAREVGEVKGWIQQYQPQRAKEIEIAYSEWNLAGGIDNAQLFSGLWASIFLGEIAKNGVAMATQWDSFTDLFFGPEDAYGRKSEYYALWLWNNYMGDRLIPATSDNQSVYTYASRSEKAVSVMLVNTDREREAQVSVRVGGFPVAGIAEQATVSSREYAVDPVTRRLLWSVGPRIERITAGPVFTVRLAPFSMTCVRLPNRAKPALSPMAQASLSIPKPAPGKPALRFLLPTEMYVGDQIRGELIAVSAGTQRPYPGILAPATLSADRAATFDRPHVRLSESVGHFLLKPATAGDLTLIARSGNVTTTHRITVKPSIPRPVVFWDFSLPPVSDKETFASSFTLTEDLTQRANRAVARVVFPADGVLPEAKAREVLKVQRLPETDKLHKENIRGVIFDLMTAPDFSCDDPDANLLVVMQSPANWWMPLGTVSLKDAKQWKAFQLDVAQPEHIKAMPSALNILFILQAKKPVKGSLYFDHIGFMVR